MVMPPRMAIDSLSELRRNDVLQPFLKPSDVQAYPLDLPVWQWRCVPFQLLCYNLRQCRLSMVRLIYQRPVNALVKPQPHGYNHF